MIFIEVSKKQTAGELNRLGNISVPPTVYIMLKDAASAISSVFIQLCFVELPTCMLSINLFEMPGSYTYYIHRLIVFGHV